MNLTSDKYRIWIMDENDEHRPCDTFLDAITARCDGNKWVEAEFSGILPHSAWLLTPPVTIEIHFTDCGRTDVYNNWTWKIVLTNCKFYSARFGSMMAMDDYDKPIAATICANMEIVNEQ